MTAWEIEIKALKAKLHSARPLHKIQYYQEIKTLEAKLSAAQKRPAGIKEMRK
jgi:ABC-type Zn uptake system ZnuABC Zn-binding protein ZnuA